MRPTEKGVEDVNIGTTENPKMVKLSKALSPEVRAEYVSLLSSFADVFAWDYSNLKTYDTSIIQHTIPIKPNQKPFRQKLRRINPKLLLSIEKEVNRLLFLSNFLIGYPIWCPLGKRQVKSVYVSISEI